MFFQWLGQLKLEINQRIIKISPLERVYWGLFFICVLIISILLGNFWGGLLIVLFLFLSVLTFEDKKELSLTLVSIFFAILTFFIQRDVYISEHRPYLGISDVVELNIDKKDRKIVALLILKNNSNYLAKNVKISIQWSLARNSFLKNSESWSDTIGAVFPHENAKKEATLSGIDSNLLEGFENGLYDLNLEFYVTYDSEAIKNRGLAGVIVFKKENGNLINASAW